MLDPEVRQSWRENFVADVPLFRAAHSTALIVDDAIAARVQTESASWCNGGFPMNRSFAPRPTND